MVILIAIIWVLERIIGLMRSFIPHHQCQDWHAKDGNLFSRRAAFPLARRTESFW